MDADLHKRVTELLNAGLGIRATARHADCSSTTVLRIRDAQADQGAPEQPRATRFVIQMRRSSLQEWKTVTQRGAEFETEQQAYDHIVDLPEGSATAKYRVIEA